MKKKLIIVTSILIIMLTLYFKPQNEGQDIDQNKAWLGKWVDIGGYWIEISKNNKNSLSIETSENSKDKQELVSISQDGTKLTYNEYNYEPKTYSFFHFEYEVKTLVHEYTNVLTMETNGEITKECTSVKGNWVLTVTLKRQTLKKSNKEKPKK